MDKNQFAYEVWQNVTAYRYIVGESFPDSFEALPVVDKQNYLLAYPLEQLCRPGSLEQIHLIGASSGFSKTGAVYWPKRPVDEKEYILGIEQMFVDNYHIDKHRTLCIECLAFGMWIGGMQLATAIRLIGLTGKYAFTIATPGLDLKSAVGVLKSYHDMYDQILILTNPSNIPIITALIRENGISLKPGTTFFPVVGEYFSESLREHICREYGHDPQATNVLWTGYGSADTGLVSYETVQTIMLRKWFAHNPERSLELFGTEDTPMILELHPSCYTEIIDSHVVVTKDQLIPLVRYDTRDRGGILERESLRGTVPDNILDVLPEQFMYVCGRADNAVIFYGTNLMINDIQDWLLSLPGADGYGGLYTVHEDKDDDISTFDFTIYTRGQEHSDDRKYLSMLIEFLCSNSAEFSIKYQNLSKSFGRPLVTVHTEDISKLQGNLKHHFVI